MADETRSGGLRLPARPHIEVLIRGGKISRYEIRPTP